MAQAQVILMPKFGQMVEESTIVSWRKKEGDSVAKGEILFEIETDKANMEVESFYDGKLLKVLVKESQTVAVQTPVAFIGNPGDTIPEIKVQIAAAAPKTESKAIAAKITAVPSAVTASGPASVPQQVASIAPVPVGPARLLISPRAARLVKEKVIDPSPIRGTGPGGRIVEKDVAAYLASRGYDKLRITPAALKMAAKEKIDILAVKGSGQIAVADIECAVAERPKPMSKMRQTIAQRLTHSFTSTPHIYVTVAVDMTDLMDLRAKLKKQGMAYTVTDFIMKAVIQSLVEFKDVNSTTDGKSAWWHSKVNLGLAVSVENGLVVPVIRSAEGLTLQELHDRAADLAAKARDGKLLPDDMTGGTFTISNMGMMNVDNFSAIINPGEGAILAVASTVRKPVVRGDAIVVRSIMKITLSADHRIVDGAIGARFANAIKSKLEDMELWNNLI